MKHTRFYTFLALFCELAFSARAEELTISPASIAAAGKADIEVALNCEADRWGGLQFDIELPAGFTVDKDEFGYVLQPTERISHASRRGTEYFDVNADYLSDGRFRVLIDNGAGKTLTGTSGTILKITLLCPATMPTETYQIGISGCILSNVDGSESSTPADNPTAGSITVRNDVEIGTAGYATFSWPLPLDFSETDCKAFVALEYGSGSLQLTQVERVPAFTGIILGGAAGTYHPRTCVGTTDDVEGNLLRETASGAVTASATLPVYALGSHNGEVGFYRVSEGVTVPLYKSYFRLSSPLGAPAFIRFGGTPTGIAQAEGDDVSGTWMGIDGRPVKPTQHGVYINNGRKVKK